MWNQFNSVCPSIRYIRMQPTKNKFDLKRFPFIYL